MTIYEGGQRAGPDLRAGQLGDVQAGDSAGESIYHGASLVEVKAFVSEYLWMYDQQQDIYRAQQAEELRRLRIELWAYRIIGAAIVVAYLIERV